MTKQMHPPSPCFGCATPMADGEIASGMSLVVISMPYTKFIPFSLPLGGML